MVNQTNILSILPTPTVGNVPLAGDIANLGDSSFQNYMKDAVRESSVAKENHSSAQNDRPDRTPSAEQNRADRPENRPVDESVRPPAEETSDTNYKESVATGENTSQRPADADGKTQPLERTDSSDPKDGQAYTDINALLQSLAQQLNLNPDDFTVEGSVDLVAQQQKLLSLLNGQGGQAAELLVKAGLTEQEAKTLLTKFQSVQGNQASLQANKEVADDVLVKLSGEKSAEGKADFLSQFSELNPKEGKPQRQASIEKVLTQAAKEPVQELSQKPADKAIVSPQKLEELFQPPVNPATPVQAQNIAANNPLKSSQGIKPPTEVQVQNVNAVSDSTAKAVDGAKSVSAETLSAKGTTEARVINQIINKVSLRSNGSQSEIKIRLDPPSLGTIRMNVTTAGDTVRTVVIAESHTVKQIIENNLTQLRDSMQNQGLKVDSFTVLVGGDEGQAGQQNTAHEGRSNFKGSPYAEQSTIPETPVENLVAGQSRVLNYDTKSLSVFA